MRRRLGFSAPPSALHGVRLSQETLQKINLQFSVSRGYTSCSPTASWGDPIASQPAFLIFSLSCHSTFQGVLDPEPLKDFVVQNQAFSASASWVGFLRSSKFNIIHLSAFQPSKFLIFPIFLCSCDYTYKNKINFIKFNWGFRKEKNCMHMFNLSLLSSSPLTLKTFKSRMTWYSSIRKASSHIYIFFPHYIVFFPLLSKCLIHISYIFDIISSHNSDTCYFFSVSNTKKVQ